MNNRAIGIVTDWVDKSRNYQMMITEGVEAFAREHDIAVHIFVVGRILGAVRRETNRYAFLEYLDRDSVDGLIILTSVLSNYSDSEPLFSALAHLRSIPLVSVGEKLGDYPTISVDNGNGIEDAVRHLVSEHRYRKIGYIGGNIHNSEAVERRTVFERVTKSLNLDITSEYIYDGEFAWASGVAGVRELLDVRKLDVDALICGNDDIAIGAWTELDRRDIMVPEDVAVVGYDNRVLPDRSGFSLATVEQPLFMIGYRSAEMVLKTWLETDALADVRLPTAFVPRASCGCPACTTSKTADGADGAGAFAEFLQAAIVEMQTRGSELAVWDSIKHQIIGALQGRTTENQLIDATESLEQMLLDHPVGEDAALVSKRFTQIRNLIREHARKSVFLSDIERDGVEQSGALVLEELAHVVAEETQFEEVPDLFHNFMEIEGCSLAVVSRIVSDADIPTAEVLFAYPNNQLNGTRYPISQVLPSAIPEEERRVVATTLLSRHAVPLGILSTTLDARGNNFFERLSNRISGILFTDYTLQRLKHEMMEKEHAEERLKEALVEVQELSLTDELTGLHNRRGFTLLARPLLRQAVRENSPVAVSFLDMDYLKIFNDEYGHDEGDRAISAVANGIRSVFREADVLARMGGDEFAVFMKNSDSIMQADIQSRLDRVLALSREKGSFPVELSVSVGVAVSQADRAATIDELLKEADQNMYESKREKKRQRPSG